MPALDRCHEQVIRALEKENWRITSSPFKLAAAERTAYVDVQLQRGSNGTQDHIILIEIKCFPDEDSTTREIYTAMGQYLLYRKMIAEINLPFPL